MVNNISLAKDNSSLPICNKTNYCILFFEIIAAIFIVFLHIKFPSLFGEVVEMIARFGVPFFFMVSGFFLFSNPNIDIEQLKKKILRRLLRLIVILLISTIIYLAYELYMNRAYLTVFLGNIFSAKRLVAFFLFNEPFFGGHLWFILALIYCYIFILIFIKWFIGKNFLLYFISSFLLLNILLNIVFYQFNFSICGISLSHYWFFRNWILEGLPFVCLGVLLRRNSNRLINIKTELVVAVLVISFIAMILEAFFYRKVLNASPIFCVFNIVFCSSIFVLAIKKPLLLSECFLFKIKGKWTTILYVIHPLFITIVSFVFNAIKFNGLVADYIMPLVVALLSCVVSILISIAFYQIRSVIKNR